MENPFQTIQERLESIETLLQNLNEKQVADTSTPILEEPLTVQDAAHFLSLSVPTIYSKVSKGELPVMKRSKRLYFSTVDLMEYLKEGRRSTNQEIERKANDYLQSN